MVSRSQNDRVHCFTVSSAANQSSSPAFTRNVRFTTDLSFSNSFLPHTVHFDVAPKELPPFIDVEEHSRVQSADYFSERPVTSHPLMLVYDQVDGRLTPGIATEHEGFFLSTKKAITPGIPQVAKDARATVLLSDPQSPHWGRRTLTQPTARIHGAPAPTLSSIVATAEQIVLRKETAVLNEKRDQLHEKAMKNASWSIEWAERGNAGLQNAVRAADRCGVLTDHTWVSTDCFAATVKLSLLGWNAGNAY